MCEVSILRDVLPHLVVVEDVVAGQGALLGVADIPHLAIGRRRELRTGLRKHEHTGKQTVQQAVLQMQATGLGA